MTTNADYSNLSLLIVDDSPINHRVVSLMLRGRFGRIDSAYNGQEAFEKYREHPYDIILMDSLMPVMDGCKSTQVIRLFEKEQGLDDGTKIIAMTASEGNDDVDRCIQAGMNAFLGKPFVLHRFLHILEEIF